MCQENVISSPRDSEICLSKQLMLTNVSRRVYTEISLKEPPKACAHSPRTRSKCFHIHPYVLLHTHKAMNFCLFPLDLQYRWHSTPRRTHRGCPSPPTATLPGQYCPSCPPSPVFPRGVYVPTRGTVCTRAYTV